MAQATERQSPEPLQNLMNSEGMSFNGTLSQEENEELSKTALLTFQAKEDEIEKKKTEVKEKVVAQLGLIEEECKRLASIREELDALGDPMKKEVTVVRKKIDAVNKELKPLAMVCQKKEREYKESLETLSEKNKEKVNLLTRLSELAGESEKMRMHKLEELSKSIETVR